MSDSPIVLSISMLVSGREEMFRSLKAIQLLREKLPCEIILVDTGCSKEQRAKIEKYADKILDFVWCDDFAAARNKGIEAANGQWFMYLDDDEWFECTEEIVSFFQSGEFKEYNCASYAVRNYRDQDGTAYDDTYPIRMVQRTPDLKFIGEIHEYLSDVRGPKKVLSDFVHHYGYAYKDEKARWRHAQRNIVPLLKMCEKYPGEPRWYGQLAQEYFSIREYEEVVRTCKKGLKEWNARQDKTINMPAYVGVLYCYILVSLEALGRLEEEEKWLLQAMEDPLTDLKVLEPTIAFYCLAGTTLYRKKRDHSLCRDYFKKYVDYAGRLKEDRGAIEIGTVGIATSVFQEDFFYGTILAGMESSIRMEDYALSEEAFYMLDWSRDGLQGQEEWEREVLDALCSAEYHPLWGRMNQTLASRENGMKELCAVSKELGAEYRKSGDADKYSRLCKLISTLNCEHYYVICARILLVKQTLNDQREAKADEMKALFDQLFQKYSEDLLEVSEEVWSAAEGLNISFEPMFLRTDFRAWRRGLERWIWQASLESIRHWDARIERWKEQEDIRYRLFARKCKEGYLKHYRELGLSLEELERMLWTYAEDTINFYDSVFKRSVFTERPEALPEEMQLAMKLQELRQYRLEGNDRNALQCVRKCLELYPVLDDVVGAYAERFRDDVERRSREAQQEQDEFLQLAASLKEAARIRLGQKEYAAAKDILLQLKRVLPQDEEIDEMLEYAGK